MDETRSRLIELAVRPDTPEENVSAALNAIIGSTHDTQEEHYFSIKDAIQYSRLSRITLWTHRKAGRLKYYRVGGRVLFKKSDLDRLVTG